MLSLYVDDEDIILAKSKQMNLSQLFVNVLRTQLDLDKSELSDKEENLTLKFKLATAMTELSELTHKFEQYKKDREIEKLEYYKQLDKVKELNERLNIDNIKLKEKNVVKRGTPFRIGDGN